MQVPFLVAQGKYLLEQVLAYVPSLMAVILGLEWSDTVLYMSIYYESLWLHRHISMNQKLLINDGAACKKSDTLFDQ